MKVFIANFGQENYEWPACRERGTIATMNEVEAQPLWEAGDREGYIASRMRGKTVAGLTPTRAVAARWYNLMTTVAQTSGDIWVHREGEKLWWTTSADEAPAFERKTEPVGRERHVVVCHKPCKPWSDRNKHGDPLPWRALHPKARDFLSTEATLQELREDFAAYTLALIYGEDLSPWHQRQSWKQKNERASSKYSEVRSYNPKQIAARREAEQRMAETAMNTAKRSNGQGTTQLVKNRLCPQSVLVRFAVC